MSKSILITGAKGFIGQNVCLSFKKAAYTTFGIGHGKITQKEQKQIGLDYWIEGDMSIDTILKHGQKFDIIIHCGGSGSVADSVKNPYKDFNKTVNGTLEILEYIRLYNQYAHLIYPSSPSVQGECGDVPIKENYIGKPVSPYGYHKKIAEDLCQSYATKYNIKVSIIRLFSVYGRGQEKQLIWDAYNKIKTANKKVTFWGTGNETRDFIHIDDVMSLFHLIIENSSAFSILNGGTGVKHTIKDVVQIVQEIVNPDIVITFNNKYNPGNPIYYWADVENLNKINFKHKINLKQGIKNFISTLNQNHD